MAIARSLLPLVVFLKPVIQMKILLAVALAVIILLLLAVGGGVGLLLKSNLMDSAGKFLNTICSFAHP